MEKKKGPFKRRTTPEESEKMIEELKDISEGEEVPKSPPEADQPLSGEAGRPKPEETKGEEPEVEGEEGMEVPAETGEVESVAEDLLGMAADVPVQVVAVLGKKTISIKELTKLRVGELVELSRPLNEVVDLVAGNRLIAKGELVDVDGKMGVKIIKMVK